MGSGEWGGEWESGEWGVGSGEWGVGSGQWGEGERKHKGILDTGDIYGRAN